MNILITGATGFVGRHLCTTLHAAGHTLFALSRSGKAPEHVEPVKGDVASGEGLQAAFDKGAIEAVIHLVGIIQEKPPEITFDKVHVRATEHVIQAAEAAGVTRFIHMSALGADLKATSQYARSKARAEEAVKTSGLTWTIHRPSLIFGPGDEFFGKVLRELVTLGPIIPQIGHGQFMFRPIWVGDVAQAFCESLAKPCAAHQVYTLVGPDVYSFAELLRLERQALQSHKPIIPIPLALMRLGVPLMQVLPNPPITTDQFQMLLAGNTGDGSAALHDFTLEMRSLPDMLPVILHHV